MTRNISIKIIQKLSDFYGDVKPALRYKSLYQLAVAVVLSAQTTDRQVNSVTPRLFGKYPDFASLANGCISDIERIIRSTGFFRCKAGHIKALARMVAYEYGGVLPETFGDLVSLPGIGRKSANVILAVGFEKPAFAVDTHVIRIANRLGFVSSGKPENIEKAVTALLPEKHWIRAHLLFIQHGRQICRAKKPLCAACPVRSWCPCKDTFP